MPDSKTETKLDYWVIESVKDSLFEENFEIDSEISRFLQIIIRIHMFDNHMSNNHVFFKWPVRYCFEM